MVRGSRRIPSPSLLLITRVKKHEKSEKVNYFTAVNWILCRYTECLKLRTYAAQCRTKVGAYFSEYAGFTARLETNQLK